MSASILVAYATRAGSAAQGGHPRGLPGSGHGGGRFDPATLRPPYSPLPAMKKLPVSDIRDWEAIATWAKEPAAKFRPAQRSPAE